MFEQVRKVGLLALLLQSSLSAITTDKLGEVYTQYSQFVAEAEALVSEGKTIKAKRITAEATKLLDKHIRKNLEVLTKDCKITRSLKLSCANVVFSAIYKNKYIETIPTADSIDKIVEQMQELDLCDGDGCYDQIMYDARLVITNKKSTALADAMVREMYKQAGQKYKRTVSKEVYEIENSYDDSGKRVKIHAYFKMAKPVGFSVAEKYYDLSKKNSMQIASCDKTENQWSLQEGKCVTASRQNGTESEGTASWDTALEKGMLTEPTLSRSERRDLLMSLYEKVDKIFTADGNVFVGHVLSEDHTTIEVVTVAGVVRIPVDKITIRLKVASNVALK